LLNVFSNFYSYCVLGSARTLTAITHQHVAEMPKAALQIVALNALILVTFLFEKM